MIVTITATYATQLNSTADVQSALASKIVQDAWMTLSSLPMVFVRKNATPSKIVHIMSPPPLM
jgi:hypothetical protein